MDYRKKDIIASFLVVIIILVTGFFLSTKKSSDNIDNLKLDPKSDQFGGICENVGGTWDAKFNECAGIDKEICNQNGGKFDECASACRHNPNAQVCTMQCVQVCYLKQNVLTKDPLNTTYEINDKKIILKNGKAEIEIANTSASKEIISIFGEPTFSDLNNDNKKDAVVILTVNSSGSGVFFYIAIAKNVNSNYIGTNAIFLGHRIAPQNVTIKGNVIIANYADRKPNEPMTVKPSIGVSRYFVLNGDVTKEIKSSNENISIVSPALYETIKSPLKIVGQAKGPYFFEASFPVFLTDWDGKIIASGVAMAKENWMTTDFVQFESTLEFKKPPCNGQNYCKYGSLIFKKNNPSQLPQNDSAFEIPIFFE